MKRKNGRETRRERERRRKKDIEGRDAAEIYERRRITDGTKEKASDALLTSQSTTTFLLPLIGTASDAPINVAIDILLTGALSFAFLAAEGAEGPAASRDSRALREGLRERALRGDLSVEERKGG